MRSNYSRIISLFLWITVDIFLWGFLTHYLNKITKPEFDFVQLLLGAILFWDFFTRIMHGVAMGFLEDVWSRNFVNLFCSPILLWEYLAGLLLSSLIIGSIALCIMSYIACFVFNLKLLNYGFMIFYFLIVLFIFGISLGILSISVILRFGPSAEWVIWPLPAVISPFAGIFYPVEILPGWMQFISRVLPASYIFESLRTIVLSKPVSILNFPLSFLLALIYLGICWFIFYLTYNYCLKTGLFAKYSAENIS